VIIRLRTQYLAAMGLPLAACPAPDSKEPVVIAEPSAPSVSATASATVAASASAPASASASATVAASASATVAASASATVAASAPPSWDVQYPNVGGPNWCRNKDARCFLQSDLGKACPRTVSVPCGCSPGTACFDPNQPCDAPAQKTVSAQETGKKHKAACCYEMPQHCVPPWVGRAFEPVAITMCGEDDWEAMALGEHASVASFARASLELLSLGAPPDLIADTHRAALDEIEHARFAYAMCGKAPAPIPIGELRKPTIVEFAVSTFLEACLPETAGAEAMRRRAERHPDKRDAIVRIAEDEEGHAELAWRTLAWAVCEGGEPAERALREAIASVRNDDAVVNEVVIPCALALVQSGAATKARSVRPG
jgi:hypothetical protein